MRRIVQNLNYGFPSPISQAFPNPVIAKRDPTPNDNSFLPGQSWITRDKSSFTFLGIQNGQSSGAQLLGIPDPIVATLQTLDDTPTTIYTTSLPSVTSAIGWQVNVIAYSITGGGCLQILECTLMTTDGTTAAQPFDTDLIYVPAGDMDAADFDIQVSGNTVTLTVYGIIATTIDWKVQITSNQVS
jgi:hypothetical protein